MNDQIFSASFASVRELAENFQANEQRFLESSYSEAQARLDFIDKFWIALGWDVNHERERNPYEQEVKVERGVAVGNRLKKADYAFFAAPNFRDVKFYVEAKKPSRNLDNADDYFQTIRYGWSSKTPIAVLTDFEQFRVVDCRCKPNIDTAQNFALDDVKFDYRDYADEAKFRRIYHLFSRESVLKGSLEEYVKTLPKRGRGVKQGRLFAGAIQKSVDESFLDDLDAYRDTLARAFKNRNAELDGEALTEAVTRTLDRLVFMRFLEDKLIEPDTMIDKFDSWTDFVRTSARLNSFYNGIVFKPHFIDSKDFNADEKVFADICGELSPKDSPYNFNYIPVHILGSIYERFLGKVIVATDKRATVQEKPEVRKAGGVYYTPEYIVRYIVENTIGKLIENKTPDEIKEMRFADIACGSGSFLLGVYDYLLRYHTDYYNSPGKKEIARKAGCVENKDGSFTLSIAQRREILRNNICGVDVDAQATEVAQLSLALKLLEDATTATTRAFQPKLGEKILPDMKDNIVCGNSLVDHDIEYGMLFENKELKKLNPMSYEDKFPEVMKRGGFDAIVGNPPYVLGREMFDDSVKNYLANNYFSYGGKFDLYIYFTEKAVKLTKQSGFISYIIPNTILSNENASKLRNLVLDQTTISKIRLFEEKVFAKAQVETVVLVLKKETAEKNHQIQIDFKGISLISQVSFRVNSDFKFNVRNDESSIKVIEKILKHSQPLGEISDICIGIQLGGSSGSDSKKSFLSDVQQNETYKKVLDGRDINNYSKSWKGVFVRYGSWLHRKRDEKYFLSPKLLFRQIGNVPVTTYDEEGFYTLNTIYNLIGLEPTFLKFCLGIINSKVVTWFWRHELSDFKNLFPKIKKTQLEKIPIPRINFADKTEKAMHDKMAALVDGMLEAKKQLQAARTDRDKNYYQDRCNAIDRQIDKLVYQLYDLTDDEIKIVEGKA